MPIDPRTPVIVGVGQLTRRPRGEDAASLNEPLELMAAALEIAAQDASGVIGRRSALLERLDELTAISGWVWQPPDPAGAVARALGISPGATRIAGAGGTLPQTLLFDAAQRISEGSIDVAAVVGAEATRSREVARRQGERRSWHEQPAGTAPAAVVGAPPDPLTPHERAVGLAVPVFTYALFESAMRRSRGLDRAAHAESIGRLAERMALVAAGNEMAWIRDAPSAAQISTPGDRNRMVATPYTKLLTSNVRVDMGAAFIIASYEAARAAGVPEDRLVFPHRGTRAYEQWFVSHRADLSASLAMRACATELFGDGARGASAVAHLDLYSCFPVVVQMAGAAMGLDVWADPRPPTVTGGLTFFGGPGNNYVTHSIATMADRLRGDPGSLGLVTALGWYASTHAWGTYSTRPPGVPFRLDDVQAAVDAEPLRAADDDYEGEGEVEAYTVVHDRDGAASRAIVSLLTPAGARRLAATEDPGAAADIEAADPLGARALVEEGSVRLP